MQNKMKFKRSFWLSPYLFILVSAYLILVTAAYYYALHDDIRALFALGGWREMVRADGFDVLAFMGVIYIVNLLIVWWVSEQYFGVLSIKDDCVVLRRPLKRAKRLGFDEIQSIGIDVGTTGAFWIYISSRSIPAEYHNKINRLTPKRCDMLFAYSDSAYRSLCEYLPGRLGKKFAASASILRLYGDKKP